MSQVNHYDVEYLDEERLHAMPAEEFKRSLKSVFDASIPWDNPQYDARFQHHNFKHAQACVIVRDKGNPVALSLAFSGFCEGRPVLYISGIWVNSDYKSQGLGRLIIESLIECGMQSCFEDADQTRYISMRTQNPQIYEYFNRHYDVFPHVDKQPSADVQSVASWVHQQYSPNKVYEMQDMIIRSAFPKGIIVGHLHPAKDDAINAFINDNLDILGGDSYILVMTYQQT